MKDLKESGEFSLHLLDKERKKERKKERNMKKKTEMQSIVLTTLMKQYPVRNPNILELALTSKVACPVSVIQWHIR